MAASAGWVSTVLLQPVTHRKRIQYCVILEYRYVRRRRWRRRTNQVLQYPMAAKHRRRAGGIGRYRKYACLSKQSAAVAIFIERHPAEVAAVNVRNSVMLRQ